MKQNRMIPFYGPDGISRGSRTIEAAERLIAGGYVKPAYGRKGHLRAIFLQQEDGSTPVQARVQGGTRYSFPEKLDSGRRCWKLRRLDRRDDDGVLVNTRGVFMQVVMECMAK